MGWLREESGDAYDPELKGPVCGSVATKPEALGQVWEWGPRGWECRKRAGWECRKRADLSFVKIEREMCHSRIEFGWQGDFQSGMVLGQVWETVWVRGVSLGSIAWVGAQVDLGSAGGQEEAQGRVLRSTAMQGRTRGRDTGMGVRWMSWKPGEGGQVPGERHSLLCPTCR